MRDICNTPNNNKKKVLSLSEYIKTVRRTERHRITTFPRQYLHNRDGVPNFLFMFVCLRVCFQTLGHRVGKEMARV